MIIPISAGFMQEINKKSSMAAFVDKHIDFCQFVI